MWTSSTMRWMMSGVVERVLGIGRLCCSCLFVVVVVWVLANAVGQPPTELWFATAITVYCRRAYATILNALQFIPFIWLVSFG